MDFDEMVADLGVAHRSRQALRGLLAAGPIATPAVRRGLAHPDPRVRAECCNVLDHFLDEAALPELVAALNDPDAHVRARALHALACDQCKEGACRPAEAEVVPVAMRLLNEDADRYVRKSAVEALGPAAHRRPDVLQVLVDARSRDPDPLVRKVSGWYCPGGPIYEGRRSKHGRLRPRQGDS
jgi:HEAT repeat protein